MMSFFISIFGNKNIGMFIYGLILSPIPSVWIDGKADGESELCDTTDEFFHYYFWQQKYLNAYLWFNTLAYFECLDKWFVF